MRPIRFPLRLPRLSCPRGGSAKRDLRDRIEDQNENFLKREDLCAEGLESADWSRTEASVDSLPVVWDRLRTPLHLRGLFVPKAEPEIRRNPRFRIFALQHGRARRRWSLAFFQSHATAARMAIRRGSPSFTASRRCLAETKSRTSLRGLGLGFQSSALREQLQTRCIVVRSQPCHLQHSMYVQPVCRLRTRAEREHPHRAFSREPAGAAFCLTSSSLRISADCHATAHLSIFSTLASSPSVPLSVVPSLSLLAVAELAAHPLRGSFLSRGR